MDFICDPSLVLYLPLHKLDRASFMSKDAYGHLCTVTGAVWRPSGRYFDGGDDYIDCGAPTGFIAGSSATITGWFKPLDANEVVQVLISRWAAVPPRWALRYDSNRTLSFYPNATESWVSSDAGVVTLDVFSHITMVKTPTEIRFYVNGEEAGSGSSPNDIDTATANIHIGKFTNLAANYHFPGTIGEITVHKRALTAIEIQLMYLATRWRYK